MGGFDAYMATRLKLAPALQRRRRREFLAEDRLWPTAAKIRRQVAHPMPVSFPSHTVLHRRIVVLVFPVRLVELPNGYPCGVRGQVGPGFRCHTVTLIAYNGQKFHVAPCLSAARASFFLDTLGDV